jgi:hypothetical protein
MIAPVEDPLLTVLVAERSRIRAKIKRWKMTMRVEMAEITIAMTIHA